MDANPWLHPQHTTPCAHLDDGTPLYPAYYPHCLPGERFRRSLNAWTGQSGEWIGVTEDGRLFQQARLWGNTGPAAVHWTAITIPH